ncbi:IclR family transcriptional regulator [Gulosibacter chungangensis]|uniref:IclR family transcriptional regulator n=1 Tax=Gulosibacter chungangensis TaxID=979746 RepID=A0A7J5BA48_9MICO|nr:IclR family transcriptional regulator [Gulosibacter chungangensis]KAB1640992.1 IclR family transcriptional regulator [Gulosibacter chungangensis]
MQTLPPPQRLEILDKANALITELEGGELTAAELAGRLDEPVSSIYRLIRTLLRLDWVMHGSVRGTYRLGLRMLAAGSAFFDTLDMRALFSPILMNMRDRTMLTVYLCLPHGLIATCVERLAGRGVRSLDMTLGSTMPLTDGGAPVAILAAMKEREAAEVIRQLEPTPAQLHLLEEKIAGFRKSGFVVTDGDVTRGVAGIATPIFDHHDRVVAGLSVGGLRHDVIGREDLVQMLLTAGQECSKLLGWNSNTVTIESDEAPKES